MKKIYPAKYWIDDKVTIKSSRQKSMITEVGISDGKAFYKLMGKKKLYKEEEIELIEK